MENSSAKFNMIYNEFSSPPWLTKIYRVKYTDSELAY